MGRDFISWVFLSVLVFSNGAFAVKNPPKLASSFQGIIQGGRSRSNLSPKKHGFYLGPEGRGLFHRSSDGKVIQLLSEPVEGLQSYQIDYGNRAHWIVSVNESGHEDKFKIALLVREDGVSVRIRTGPPIGSVKNFTLRDGILSFSGALRKIDLDRLEAEARFIPGLPIEVVDSDEKVISPIKLTKSRFRDLMDDVRRRPENVFESPNAEVIERLHTGLLRRNAGSVVILGSPGTGKTELVKAFLKQVLDGKITSFPRTLQVLVVDPSSLSQGTGMVGVIETRIQALLETCRQTYTILFVDEIQGLRGIGTHSGNMNDVFEYFKTALADGSLRMIGTSTKEEFVDTFGGDGAIMRRFFQVEQPESTGETLRTQIRTWLEKTGRPSPNEELQQYAIRLTDRFNAIGAEPGKTTAFLDLVYAMLEARGRCDAPTRADLEEAASKYYGVNSVFFDPTKVRTLLSELPRALDENIVGLSDYKEALISLTRLFYSNTHDARRPAIRILAAGPAGTGKTELARIYAEAMGLPFVRIEMNQYQYGLPDALLEHVARILRTNAFTVILFDEVEKASIEVQNSLLAMLDDGIFTVMERAGSAGQRRRAVRVNARNASIIATTNAGSGFLFKHYGAPFGVHGQRPTTIEPDEGGFRSALVEDGLAPLFLDRCQYAVEARPPMREEFRSVIALHLRNIIREQSERHSLTITLSQEALFLDNMTDQYFSEGMSNRVAHDIMLEQVRLVLSDLFLTKSVNGINSVTLHYNPDKNRLQTRCSRAIDALLNSVE